MLPAAVGVAIIFGSTLPLGFAAAAALSILASVKVAAAGAALVTTLRSTDHVTLRAHLLQLGRAFGAAKEVRSMRKLILATLLAATMALAFATTVGAGPVPPCC